MNHGAIPAFADPRLRGDILAIVVDLVDALADLVQALVVSLLTQPCCAIPYMPSGVGLSATTTTCPK